MIASRGGLAFALLAVLAPVTARAAGSPAATRAPAPPASAPASLPAAPESAPIPLGEAVEIDPTVDTGEGAEKRTVEILGEAFSAAIGAGLQVRLASAREAPGIGLSAARLSVLVRAEDLLDLRLFLQLELNPLVDDPVELPPFLGPAQPIFPLADAYLAFNVASAAIGNLGHLRIGQFKVPFGAEPLVEPVDLLVPERSWALRALSPGRDIGIEYGADFHGYGLPVAASVGVFNGSGPNRFQDLADLLGAARIWGRIGKGGRSSLTLRYGLSWMMDTRRTNPTTGVDDAATAFGADLSVRWRWLTVAVEGVVATTDSERRGLEAVGGYATVGVQIIPEFLELVGRYERFVPDLGLAGLGGAGAAWRASGGLDFYYLGDRFRLQYLFTYGDDGSSGANVPGPEHFFFFTLRT